MRDFSKVSPTVWRSRKFKALGDDSDARLAYFYVLTNPHANSAGCYELPPAYGAADLGWPEERYRKALQSLSEVGLIGLDEGEPTLLVANWLAFNTPTNPKHALGILDQLDAVSSASLKAARFHELKEAILEKGWERDRSVGGQIAKALDRLGKGFREGIATETRDRDLDREGDQTERETETSRATNARAKPLVGGAAHPDGAPPPDRHVAIREMNHLLDTAYMRSAAAKC